MKLHCNDCSHDYDTILSEDELDAAVCPRCGSFGSSVPVIPDVKETQEEPLAPPPPAAPVAESPGGRNQSEASSKIQEGSSRTPPRENAAGGNVEGRFSRVSSKKGLFVAAGIIVILLIAASITWFTKQAPGTPNGVDVVIETETVQTPEKKAEETGKQTESQALQTPPEKPAPVHQEKKTVKKTPKVAPAPKASTPSNTPWRYRVEPLAPQPRTQAKETGNRLGKLFKVFDGPAPDVTPPPSVNDPRGSGM